MLNKLRDKVKVIEMGGYKVGDSVTLRDGSTVTIVEIASDLLFIGEQANGNRGIFYANRIKQ